MNIILIIISIVVLLALLCNNKEHAENIAKDSSVKVPNEALQNLASMFNNNEILSNAIKTSVIRINDDSGSIACQLSNDKNGIKIMDKEGKKLGVISADTIKSNFFENDGTKLKITSGGLEIVDDKKFELNANSWGGDYGVANFSGGTEDAVKQCMLHSQCNRVSCNGNQCWLKGPQVNGGNDWAAWTIGNPKWGENVKFAGYTTTNTENHNDDILPGGRIPNLSWSECLDKCKSNNNCALINWNAASKECVLKSGGGPIKTTFIRRA